jgi:phosphatidylinositol glycan class T
MALGFGSIFNILVRRFVAVDEVPPSQLGLLLAAAGLRLRGRVRAISSKITGKRSKTE